MQNKVNLFPYQIEVLPNIKNGSIICGNVGSGKTLTALAYYYLKFGGDKSFLEGFNYKPMKNPKPLYIITTAATRDKLGWEKEMIPFLIYTKNIDHGSDPYNYPLVTVDSWNNIKKYTDVHNSFFIFDEQRVVGKGVWVKSFLQICKNNNEWILCSATPGDSWMDYVPVFIANGFYRNRTDFHNQHVQWKRNAKWPQVQSYFNQGILVKHRNDILINMDYHSSKTRHHEYIYCDYDIQKYKALYHKDAFGNILNPDTKEPFMSSSEFCYYQRKLVNTSDDRQVKLLEILEKHPRVIIFYNFDYELDLIKRSLFYPAPYDANKVFEMWRKVAEWNGHKHEPIPDEEGWIYLVQYTAGAEGWNCTETDTVIFYSNNYSYKTLEQACGRIDRLNSPYTDLYYYHLSSKSSIDILIERALKNKKQFNESRYYNSIKDNL